MTKLLTEQEETFDMVGWYERVAENSDTYFEYFQDASNGLALLCLGFGRVPEGGNYENFTRAWKHKND